MLRCKKRGRKNIKGILFSLSTRVVVFFFFWLLLQALFSSSDAQLMAITKRDSSSPALNKISKVSS